MSRAVIILFTKVQRNTTAQQTVYENVLDDAIKDASQAVGEMVKFGKALQNSQEYFENDVLPFIRTHMTDDRLHATNSLCLFAAEKVTNQLNESKMTTKI